MVGSEARANRLAMIANAIEKVRANVRYFANQEASLVSLQDEVAAFRQNNAPERLRQTKSSFIAARGSTMQSGRRSSSTIKVTLMPRSPRS